MFQLVPAATSQMLTTPPAINAPPLVSSVLASLPFALVAFLQSQLLSTTITARVTVPALLVPTQTGSTVPYAIVPHTSARPAVYLPRIAPPAQLATFHNLALAPALLVAQPLAHIQLVTRSIVFAFLPVQITWCLSTSVTTSIRVNTALTTLINSPPLHLVSPPVPIITMPIALSGSVPSAMPAATHVTADTQKIVPHALQPPPSVICCSRCVGQFVREATTQTTLPVPACSAQSISTAATAPIKTQPITSSALLAPMATSYKVARTPANLPAIPINSQTWVTTHVWPVTLPASLAVDLDRPHAPPVSYLCFTLVM